MTYYSGFVPSGLTPGQGASSRIVAINQVIGGITMVGALLNEAGLRVLTWDTQGNIYFVKKNTSQNPTNADLLFADQFSLLPSANRYIWATDSDMIGYSHGVFLGSDIPASPQPTLTAGAGAGTGPVLNFLAGTLVGDCTMVVHVKTGTTPAANTLFTATFVETFLNEPVAVISPYGAAALGVQPYINSIGTTSFSVAANVAPAASTDYYFQILCQGT